MCSCNHIDPVERYSDHLAPSVCSVVFSDEDSCCMVQSISFLVASEMNHGSCLWYRVIWLATPIHNSQSARHKSENSSNPELSSTNAISLLGEKLPYVVRIVC